MARSAADGGDALASVSSLDLVPVSSVAGEFTCYQWKNVFVNVWLAPTTMAGITAYEQDFAPIYARHPEGLSTINLIAPGLHAAPSPDVREELTRLVQRYSTGIAGAAIVIPSGGFWSSAIRGVSTALSLVSRRKLRLQVFGSAREAAEWLPPIHLQHTGVALDVEELALRVEHVRAAHL